jgi:hypothetical protein
VRFESSIKPRTDGALSAALTELEAVGEITGMMATAMPPTMMAADAQRTRLRLLPESQPERAARTNSASASADSWAGGGASSASSDALSTGGLSTLAWANASAAFSAASGDSTTPPATASVAQEDEQ